MDINNDIYTITIKLEDMSRKKIFFILFACCFSFITYKLIITLIVKTNAENASKILPTFSFQTLEKTTFKTSDINDINSKIVINYFNPSCEHCQYLATQYYLQRKNMQQVQILLITNADINSTNIFYRKYKLDSIPKLVLLLDLLR